MEVLLLWQYKNMAAKRIVSGKAVRTGLLAGVKTLADTVTITLGPKGRNVGLEKTWVEPVVLHDGVSVAKEIELEDPIENFGAQLVRQASSQTADKAGDGTTTSTLLAYKMIEKGMQYLDQGINPMVMQKGMNIALHEYLELLKNYVKDIKTKDEIRQVATISAANAQIGEKIAEAIERVGKDGVVDVDIYEGMDLTVEYREGMEFDRGYISSQFKTNEKGEAEIEAPHILITDHAIVSGDEIAKLLKKFTEETNRMEIVIIANNIDGPALSTLLLNKERGGVTPLGVFAPSIGERQKQYLEDIAAVTGGSVVYRETTKSLSDVTIDQLGRADKVVADANVTKIIGGHGAVENIKARAVLLRDAIKAEEKEFEKKKLRERLARLIAGAAVIKVGAVTEVELSDKRERVIDAVEATKAAVAEGIVPGGGITLLAMFSLTGHLLGSFKDKDIVAGVNVVRDSLVEPYKKLLSNAGYTVDDKMLQKAITDALNGKGLNVATDRVDDMLRMGVIDPARVTREALQNAVSVAGMILTTDAVVYKIPEEKKV